MILGVLIIDGDGEGDGVIMELEMNWDGNLNIIFDIKIRFGLFLFV